MTHALAILRREAETLRNNLSVSTEPLDSPQNSLRREVLSDIEAALSTLAAYSDELKP